MSTTEQNKTLTERLAERNIRKSDSVIVMDVDRFTERSLPYIGNVVEISDDSETVRVTNYDDEHGVDLVDPYEIERTFNSEAEACAFLAARSMSEFCQAFSEGKIIKVWIDDMGKSFMNVGNAFDLDVCEIGPLDAYNETIQAEAPEWATTYANFYARGLRDPDTDGWGYGTPTHSSGRAGAVPKDRDDLDGIVVAAANAAGIDLGDEVSE